MLPDNLATWYCYSKC